MNEQKPKPRGFSGKSALVKSKREERLALIDSVRCSVCKIPMTDDVRVHACCMADCPKTNKRFLTEEEKQNIIRGQR